MEYFSRLLGNNAEVAEAQRRGENKFYINPMAGQALKHLPKENHFSRKTTQSVILLGVLCAFTLFPSVTEKWHPISKGVTQAIVSVTYMASLIVTIK